MFDAFQTYSDSSSASDGRCDSVLTIVFEHVDQDLSMFLHKYPSPCLPEPLIKVSKEFFLYYLAFFFLQKQ